MATPQAKSAKLERYQQREPGRDSGGGRAHRHGADHGLAGAVAGQARALRAAALLGVCALAGCPPAVVRNPEGSQKRYLLAADFFNRGMIPAAQVELKQAIELDDRNVEAYYLLGLISLREVAELEDDALRARCLPPAEQRLAREDMASRMRKAEESFRKAIAIQPDYADAWNALATAALHFHRWDDALRAAEKALANPTYPTPWFALANQGVALYEKRDYLRAGQALRKALAQNEKFCVARWRLAQVYYAQSDDERADQELKTLTEDKKCPIQEAFQLLGQVALRRSDRVRADEAFKECRRLAPKSCAAKECRLADEPSERTAAER